MVFEEKTRWLLCLCLLRAGEVLAAVEQNVSVAQAGTAPQVAEGTSARSGT